VGRKAKPIGLLVLDKKTHLTKEQIERREQAEVKPRIENIDCPDWLCENGRKEWNRVQEELKRLGLLTMIDVTALAIYCDAVANYIKATEEIKKYGQVIKHTNKSGATNIVTNPYVQIANKYADVIKKFSTEFGLTPSARASIAISKEEKKTVTEEEKLFGDAL
jgi:P27 family predicted phage terminase small subunit